MKLSFSPSRHSRWKTLLAVAAIVVCGGSLLWSHWLVADLADEERTRMLIWAEAMRCIGTADDETDLSLVLRVVNSNHTIPVVVLNRDGDVETYRNLHFKAASAADTLHTVAAVAQEMKAAGRVIRISLDRDDYMDVCYDESIMLRRLARYPYIQLGIIVFFVATAIVALLSSKRAEQNRVWVGLSKETAHQLGTPISSLLAWTQMLHETYPDDELLPEMDKDVQRLQMIAERFSKIGSQPELQVDNVGDVIAHVADYIARRTSSRVDICVRAPQHPVYARINASLFEWVVENLCKNAVDAMDGRGNITITTLEEASRIAIEVADTGKGIAPRHLKDVFQPGFTTKKRGWGLGLSLAKRIVEDYHQGRIYVKASEPGRGTTFRIELRK